MRFNIVVYETTSVLLIDTNSAQECYEMSRALTQAQLFWERRFNTQALCAYQWDVDSGDREIVVWGAFGVTASMRLTG